MIKYLILLLFPAFLFSQDVILTQYTNHHTVYLGINIYTLENEYKIIECLNEIGYSNPSLLKNIKAIYESEFINGYRGRWKEGNIIHIDRSTFYLGTYKYVIMHELLHAKYPDKSEEEIEERTKCLEEKVN